MATTAIRRARTKARRAEDNPWLERVGRAGLAARGVIYCVVAALAVAVAANRGQHRGPSSHEVDRQGALQAIAHQPFGRALLVVLAAGFACYALWRFLKAAYGAGEGSGSERGGKGAVKRAADVGRGLIYVTLLANTVRAIAHGSASGGTNAKAKSWSARFMTHPAGRWLVVAVGAALIVTGAVLVVRALKRKFEKHLDEGRMRAWQRRWFPRLGLAGYASRGIVAALVGIFFVQAAVTFDAGKAVGIDGALRRLAHQPLGPLWLGAVAAGLAAFGGYSFVEAGWRNILED